MDRAAQPPRPVEHPAEHHPAPHSAWRDAVAVGAVLLAALGGAVIAWFQVAFQLFGATADASDHRTGGLVLLGTAGLVLVLGTAAALPRSRWVLVLVGGLAAVLLVAALGQLHAAVGLPTDAGSQVPGWTTVFDVLAAPTSWPLVALALLTAVARR
jgi:hypothetical protein